MMINVKDHGVKGDGTLEDVIVLNSLIAGAVGDIYFPAGEYLIDRSIDLRGKSNITIMGDGKGATVIKCTTALNGSSHITHNNIFDVNNLTVPVGSYLKNVTIKHLTIDASLQNCSGIPVGQQLGYNLCAIEFQNVDHASAIGVEVIGAYGNGIAFGSIDPSMAGAIRNPVIEDCDLTDVCRGVLPQYGITGSVIQIGAAIGGRANNNRITRAGAPWMDAFNCFGTQFNDNFIDDIGSGEYEVGQNKGIFHSDFGLNGVSIKGNVSRNAGGFIINGLMAPNFFNAQTPTPGLKNSTVQGNMVFGHGLTAYTAPSVPASNVTINSPAVPMMITLLGGNATAWINGVQQRLSGATYKTFIAPPNSFIKLVYTTTPSWVWQESPNAFVPHFRFMGGSTATLLGQAFNNDISGNLSHEAPGDAFMFYDAKSNQIMRNRIFNCGNANGFGNAFSNFDTLAGASGTGSKDNLYGLNEILETRAVSMLGSNYKDNGPNNTGNKYFHNKNGTTMSGNLYSTIATLATVDNY
jgi:hypothetical protein